MIDLLPLLACILFIVATYLITAEKNKRYYARLINHLGTQMVKENVILFIAMSNKERREEIAIGFGYLLYRLSLFYEKEDKTTRNVQALIAMMCAMEDVTDFDQVVHYLALAEAGKPVDKHLKKFIGNKEKEYEDDHE